MTAMSWLGLLDRAAATMIRVKLREIGGVQSRWYQRQIRFSQEKQQFKNWVTVLTGVRERTVDGQLAEGEVPQRLGPQGASLRRRR